MNKVDSTTSQMISIANFLSNRFQLTYRTQLHELYQSFTVNFSQDQLIR